jgi:hypothetical protein
MRNQSVIDPIGEVLRSPCTHRQLKAALEAFLQMDPIDAANDADLLAELMDARCENFL